MEKDFSTGLTRVKFPQYRGYDELLDDAGYKIFRNTLYLSVDGVVRNGIVAGYSYDSIDKFPQICRAEDNIWTALQQYNLDRLPCGQISNEKMKTSIQSPAVIETALAFKYALAANAQDELSQKEQLNLLKTIIKAANDGVKTQKELKIYQQMENVMNSIKTNMKDWKQLAKESAAFFRGEPAPQEQIHTIIPGMEKVYTILSEGTFMSVTQPADDTGNL